MQKEQLIIIIILAILFLALSTSVYIVDVKEYAVLTELGKPKMVIKEPGLKWKIPFFIQNVTKLDNRLLVYEPLPAEYLTFDKKNIVVSSFVLWKIEDPLRFLQRVYNRQTAESRLSDVVSSELGSKLGNVPFSALISTKSEERKLSQILKEVTEDCHTIALEDYGIHIVDVRIKRLNFPERNKASVFDRMKAERSRIAKKYRSEGESEAIRIRAEADREKERILANAYRSAEEIKGKGEAEAITIYAASIRKDPDFYQFLRTLETYEKIIDENTTIVLPSDSKLLRLMNEGP